MVTFEVLGINNLVETFPRIIAAAKKKGLHPCAPHLAPQIASQWKNYLRGRFMIIMEPIEIEEDWYTFTLQNWGEKLDGMYLQAPPWWNIDIPIGDLRLLIGCPAEYQGLRTTEEY